MLTSFILWAAKAWLCLLWELLRTIAVYVRPRGPSAVRRNGRFKAAPALPAEDPDAFDVVVAGAGPAGATAAYYLARGGLRVALLEKGRFPRDKVCGDCWCGEAVEILAETGALGTLRDAGALHEVVSGGFVSPSGIACVFSDPLPLSTTRRQALTVAIKRTDGDEHLARAAEKAGAKLFEQTRVVSASLDYASGVWRVSCDNGRAFHSRLLFCADGVSSALAQSLGIVKEHPTAVCTRELITPSADTCRMSGTMFYPSWALPGYLALSRHSDGSFFFGLYALPGVSFPMAKLRELHETAKRSDPFISRAIGENPRTTGQIDVWPIRIGGIAKSFSDHLLIVGDAAGQTDPLTGEGIHTSMVAGRIAAHTALEMFVEGDFSEASCSVYERRWKDAFGRAFAFSSLAVRVVALCPFVLDAVAQAIKRCGPEAMATFGEVMTGARPKYALVTKTPKLVFWTALLFVPAMVDYFKNSKAAYTTSDQWTLLCRR